MISVKVKHSWICYKTQLCLPEKTVMFARKHNCVLLETQLCFSVKTVVFRAEHSCVFWRQLFGLRKTKNKLYNKKHA